MAFWDFLLGNKQSIFNKIKIQAFEHDLIPNTKKAREWYLKNLRKMKAVPTKLIKDKERNRSKLEGNPLGKMVMFFYNPKMKNILPYYDRFPCVFIFQKNKDGFHGINLHYIFPKHRLLLMNKLMILANDKTLGDRARLKLTYKVLKGFTKFKWARPCIKRYLYKNIKGKFLQVKPVEWEIAVFLPCEMFRKAKSATVWRESKKKY